MGDDWRKGVLFRDGLGVDFHEFFVSANWEIRGRRSDEAKKWD
jgi:hypothetical protein